MKPLVEFRQATFAYQEREIFRSLDARIAADGCIALIGRNGAGKTTLLRMAAGTLPPSAGEVLLDGRPMSQLRQREIARSIAFVPQDVEIPFSITVEQFVEQGRTPFLPFFGGPDRTDRECIERAMHQTDTWDLRARLFNQLSGGERQRVKIALALAQQPRLLLLDEPLQHLDIGRQLELLDLLRSLRAQGIAILAAMHDLNLIECVFASVWLLRPGQPMLQGAPSQILRPEVLEPAFRCRSGQLASYVQQPQARIEIAS